MMDGQPGMSLVDRSICIIQPMRKIELQMLDAIERGISWRSANTEVRQECHPERGWLTKVELHGQLIATISETDSQYKWLELHFGSVLHFSRTTFSRLNALTRELIGSSVVYQRKHQPFISTRRGEFELETGDTYTFICN